MKTFSITKTLLVLILFIAGITSSYAQNCTVNAGIDNLDHCYSAPLTLDGNSNGSIDVAAEWTQVGGASTTIDNPSNLSSSISGYMIGNTYTYRIAATCEDGYVVYDDVSFTILPITIADAGENLESCPGSGNLSANSPDAGETGEWTIEGSNNAGISITTPSDPNSAFTTSTSNAGTTTVRWTITGSNSCSSYDEMTITNYGGVTPVTAGSDQNLSNCYIVSQSTTLNASEGGTGVGGQEGTWTMVSGPNYPTFSNINDEGSNISNLIEGTYVLRWEVAGTCANGNDEMTIVVPAATQDVSNASGTDVRFCNGATEAILSGSYPQFASETVTWTQTGGPAGATITNPNDPSTSVTGLDGNSNYTFRYEIENPNSTCTMSDNGVTIKYYDAPTVNITDADMILDCGDMTAKVNYTMTGGSNRKYKIISGPYTTGWKNTGSSSQNITFTESGTYTVVFRRYASGYECGDAFDEINITVSENPTDANAGTDQTLACNIVETDLAGNNPTDGFGYWTQIDGPNTAIIADPYDESSHISGLIEGVYSFRWLVSGGPYCPTKQDDVNVIVSTPTTTASAAGFDMTVCSASVIYLDANAPDEHETGTWTVTPSAGITFSDNNDPKATVYGLSNSTVYTFTWTISNPCSSDATDITVTTGSTTGPSEADAGPNQCQADGTVTTTMAGNNPAVGQGTWTILNGPNSPSISNVNVNNTTITGMINGIYEIEWSITNVGCQTTRDTTFVTIAPTSTTSIAGGDQELCNNSVTLSATAPTEGLGTWTQVSGHPGWSISDEHNSNATISNLQSGTYEFMWTVGYGNCPETSDNVIVHISNTPTTANAGGDQNICGATTATLDANSPTVGTGHWAIVGTVANNPNMSDINNPTTGISNLVTGAYTYRWSIISGAFCPPSTDDVLIQVSAPAKAGNDQQLCNSSEALLTGTDGSNGTWTEVTSIGAVITPNTDYTAIASNLVVEDDYTFRYTVPAIYGCPETSDDVIIQTSPYGEEPNAGTDKEICTSGGNQVTMDATSPGIGVGQWVLISGPNTPTITNDALNTTTVTGLIAGLYIYEWNVEYNWCANYSDIVRIDVYDPPTTAVAGADQPNACELDAQLEGNQPTLGIGMWTLASGPGTIDINNPNLPNSTVSNPSAVGTYTFQWEITNGTVCAASTDQVDITFTAPAPTVPNAGIDQPLCDLLTTSMTGNTASSGVGTWTKFSGPAGENITSPNSETTNITGITSGTYEFVWKIVSGGCELTDTMVVVNSTFITANAGSDADFCEFKPVSLNANAPAPSQGTWSYISGPTTPFISNPNDFSSSVNGTTVGTYTFQWDIDNGNCASSSNQVDITVITQADLTLAVTGSTICPGSDGTLTISSAENNVDYEAFIGTTSVGTGTGTGANLVITIANADLSAGDNIINIKANKGVCDDVTLNNYATITVIVAPTVTLSASPTTIVENGGVSTLTATLSNVTCEDVIVNLGHTGTATNTTDYGVATSITITQGSLTGTTNITAINDNIYEGSETVITDISTVTGGGATEDGTQQVTITITDDEILPTVTLSASPTTILENGGTSTLTATLNNATFEDVTVNLIYSGTAINATDYGVANSITISAGSLTGTTDITAVNDVIYEGNETVITDISTVTGGGATEDGDQQETVTIDDSADEPTISISDASATEGDVGTTDMDFTVTLSNESYQTITVEYATADNTATLADNDYNEITTTTLTFNPGETSKIVTVQINGDEIYEGDETLFVDLSNPNNATILDNQGEGIILEDESPNANDDTYTIDEDVILNENVSTNDTGLDNTPLTFTIITDVTNGTLVLNNDGTFTYTPNGEYSGGDSFVYEVCDNGDECSQATVTITINPVNNPIYAGDDSIEVDEDDSVTGTTVLENDGDNDGSTLSVNTTPILDVTNGTLVINIDGTYTYTPNENFTGTDYFIYEVCNDEDPQECTTATVVITVNPVNDSPIAVDDFATTDEGTPVSGTVIPNDSDIDGDNLIVSTTLLSEPTNGTVVINPDGTYTYTPDADFTGTDIFIYEVCDDGTPQLCSHAIVTITVNPAGDLYANNDVAEVDEDGTLNGTTVLVNDGDSDGSTLTVNTTPISDVSNGTLILNTDGTYTYTPNPDFNGTDSFTYEVCNDEDPVECETAIVIITVNPVNDAPIAGDDTATTEDGTPVSGDVTPNDYDPDGDNLTVNTTPTTDPTNGTVVINSDGTYTYTPTGGFTGEDTFTYEICDDGLPQECTTATVTITVNPSGELYANDDEAIVNEDGVLNGTTVLVNDGDSDGSTLTVSTTIVTDPTNGAVVINPDGTYTYTPNPDFSGEDSFIYEVCNDEDLQECTTATVTITVQPINDILFANDDNAEVDEDEILYGTTILVNDGDNDGSTIIVNTIPVIYPENGTVTINSDGTYTYIPFPDFNGEDSFTYEICNDETPQECETAVVTITVNPVNDAPVAEDDIVTTEGNNPISGDVAPNDFDPDGDDLIVTTTPLDGPNNGEIIINPDGTFTYTPDDGFVGTDTIVYEICDDQIPPECTTAEIIIVVTEPGVIYANNDFAEVDEDGTLNGTTVLVNDGDSDGSTLTVNTTPISDVENGTLVLNGDGTYTYTPNPDFNGTDYFTYEVCNDEDPVECTTAIVTIIVNPINDAPVAVDDNFFTEEEIPVNGDVTPNDYDVDGDIITVNTTPIIDVTNGTLIINPDGTFTYTPNPGFTGDDTFTYEICDDATPQECDQAVVTITVGTSGDLYANDDYYEVYEDNILMGSTVLVNDGDSDGSAITVTTTPISDVTQGTLTLNWNGTFTYSPDPDYYGEDQFTYEITNDEDPQETAQAVVYITVDPVNDPPVAVDDFATTNLNTPVVGNVLTNDYDVDGDNLILNTTPIIDPTNGTVVINPDGTYTYTPNTDFEGTDNFVYQICDDGLPQLCTQAVVTITVIDNNNPIYAEDDFAEVDENGVLNGTTVLVNDGDLDGSTLTVTSTPVVDVTNGTLVLNTDGTYTYTPTTDFVGTDSFTYEVCNDEIPQECTTAVVTITVNAINNPIFANDDTAEVDEDEVLNGTTVLVNDGDLDGSTLTVTTTPIIDVENGTLVLNTDGTYTYTPNEDFYGTDSFTYQVCNDETPQECTTAVVTITINPINDTPDAEDDFAEGDLDTDIEGDVSTNDTGLGDTTVVFTLDTDVENGTLTFNEDGTFTYTPDTDFVGEDSFTYTVCDADGECSTATVILTVIGDVITEITIPEGFSPNGDGVNETFVIVGLENYPNHKVTILNRWGNKVYEASPYLNDWDGTNMFGISVGGNKLPVGTYFYIIELEDGKVEKGYIYLNK